MWGWGYNFTFLPEIHFRNSAHHSIKLIDKEGYIVTNLLPTACNNNVSFYLYQWWALFWSNLILLFNCFGGNLVWGTVHTLSKIDCKGSRGVPSSRESHSSGLVMVKTILHSSKGAEEDRWICSTNSSSLQNKSNRMRLTTARISKKNTNWSHRTHHVLMQCIYTKIWTHQIVHSMIGIIHFGKNQQILAFSPHKPPTHKVCPHHIEFCFDDLLFVSLGCCRDEFQVLPAHVEPYV